VTTTTQPGQPRYLPDDVADHADELCFRIRGVVECIRGAANAGGVLRDEAISGACFAVDGMLEEIERIVDLRQPKKQAAQPAAGA
jgi:hypothetical protein